MNFFKLNEMLKPSYTAVVLDDSDRFRLLQTFPPPYGWKRFGHHMTINLGGAATGPAANFVGQETTMKVVAIGQNDKAMAVAVETDIPSQNAQKHITLGVSPDGGKPADSKEITDWTPVQPIIIKGRVAEVAMGGVVISS